MEDYAFFASSGNRGRVARDGCAGRLSVQASSRAAADAGDPGKAVLRDVRQVRRGVPVELRRVSSFPTRQDRSARVFRNLQFVHSSVYKCKEIIF